MLNGFKMKIDKPQSSEYAPFYQGYIEQLDQQDVLTVLKDQLRSYEELVLGLTSEQLQFAYAPDKWKIIDVMGHINDVERIMSYRLLRFSRGDFTVLPGFDENSYVSNGHFSDASKESLLKEFLAMRAANLELISRLSEDQMLKSGESNGSICSVRALIYILAGHLQHHVSILVERYKI